MTTLQNFKEFVVEDELLSQLKGGGDPPPWPDDDDWD